MLLKLVDASDAPMEVRQAAATFFKNTVKQHWAKIEGETSPLGDEDRTVIKQHLIQLMCSVPNLLQNQVKPSLLIVRR